MLPTPPKTADSFHSATTITTARGPLAVHDLSAVPGSGVLPFAHKVVLENLLRHEDGHVVTRADVEALVSGSPRPHDIAFHPARAFLHDTNGVPALTDLAALRDALAATGHDPTLVNPVIPAHLTVDHSVATDHFDRPDAPALNVEREYERNSERYRFLKWGRRAFTGLEVVPPGAGIMHQINVEHLADVVTVHDGAAFPDTVAGTDSHTTMVNGLGVLAWGVGGLEVEAAMLGQPVSMLIPPVVGVELLGRLRPGVTATDLVLTLTQRLRAHGVVGAFVEFSGHGVSATSIATRCTIANMAPEFGATAAVFPIDQATVDFLRHTGREEDHVRTVETYARHQGLWHDPARTLRYDEVVRFDLDEVTPSLAGPRRPQDRVDLGDAPGAAAAGVAEVLARPGPTTPDPDLRTGGPGHGAVAIASITSCTNTSNPAVMVAAGLLARNAVARGLRRKPWVKTSLAPGSRVVTDYLERAGLTPALDALGFSLVGYGCMTCIGNSGGLVPELARQVADGLVVASVLSGNRNFDGRIHNDVAMNFLASPPLVVAYAIAGSMDVDLTRDPLGHDEDGVPVHLADLWPSDAEVADVIASSVRPETYREVYARIFDGEENWRALEAPDGDRFAWDEDSTYLRRPPFLDDAVARVRAGEDLGARPMRDVVGARVLEFVRDSVTTDHICPAGRIPTGSAAGRHLLARGVAARDLNSYASRRGNWEVMTLGGFANPRLENRLLPGGPAAHTRYSGPGTRDGGAGLADVVEVHEASRRHAETSTPLVVLAGREYGTGSSRDWAAKVTALLGVRVVLAESFERIHRSNLVGTGVLPLQFQAGESADSLELDGTETFTFTGLEGRSTAPEHVEVHAVHPTSGTTRVFRVRVRLDTPQEHTYYRVGGLLPFVMQQTLAASTATAT